MDTNKYGVILCYTLSPMSAVFLLSGENLYALDQERKRWIDGFIEKHGMENLIRLDGKNTAAHTLMDECSAAPFIAQKRLVILSGIPKMEKGEIGTIREIQHPQTILLIIDPKPDKRLSSTKELLGFAEHTICSPLHGEALRDWLTSHVQSCGSQIDRPTASHLIHTVGEDQMLLATEIEKLATFASHRSISTDDIDTLVVLSEEQAGWKLIDLLAAQKTEQAIAFAKELLTKGESPHAVWSRLVWVVSQLTLVVSAVEDGQTAPPAITKMTGVNFGTVRTVLPIAKRIEKKTLENIVSRFALIDKDLKTGRYKSTAEAPEELLSLIDQSIVSLSTL